MCISCFDHKQRQEVNDMAMKIFAAVWIAANLLLAFVLHYFIYT